MKKRNFRYLPVSPGAEKWGLVVTGAGRACALPGSAYPPDAHPEGHMFDWRHGRTLAAYQIVCLHEGGGELESRRHPPQTVKAGEAFLLAPGEWHRYRPNAATGWTESWIEFQGAVADDLLASGQLGKAMVARPGAIEVQLPEAMDAIFDRVIHALPAIDPEASALAMRALAAWQELWLPPPVSDGSNAALRTAVEILERDFRAPMDLEDLAAHVGMPYSTFRRLFQRHTGFAPWQYVQNLRLASARRRLGQSADPVEAIADDLGFHSAFHFSTAFRKAFGVSPRQWRSGKNGPEPAKPGRAAEPSRASPPRDDRSAGSRTS